jgi:5-hydroxyisourate hydrolase-like protein (transthyretin family)
MKTATFSRALALGVTAALASTCLQMTPASAAPGDYVLVASSQDGDFFELADYTDGDITVQVQDSSVTPAADVDVDDAQDLAFSWEFIPFGASSGTRLPATDDSVQPTDVKGEFVVALPVSEGPGTYQLTAALTADAAGDNAVDEKRLATYDVGNDAPAGSTATITGLDPVGSTPGLTQRGTVRFVDDNGDPLRNQVFSMKVDHGFFTSGDAAKAPVVGAPAGDLEQLGSRLTDLSDANGEIDFELGIARDAGFDDDADIDATVSTVSGPAASATAAWSTDDPLNGRLALRLSPAGEQDGPVDPALAGNRTFYDIFALDQFGNPVDTNRSADPDDTGEISIALDYTGNTDDFDYSDDEQLADLDTFGDFWLTSFEAGTINVNGLWEEAPTYLYTDTQGTATDGVTNVTATTPSSTYEISFAGSSYSITSSAADTVRVGSTVTQTVRVLDQRGNPVSGYEVRFLRYGPDSVRGDVVATRTTNAAGEASYSFIGTARGRATVTAEITDGVRRRQLTGTAAFGAGVKARLGKTRGTSAGRGTDRLTVSAGRVAAGARVDLYRVVKGVQKKVATKTLGRRGTANFAVRDKNRGSRTTYVAQVRSTSTTVADRSNGYKTR